MKSSKEAPLCSFLSRWSGSKISVIDLLLTKLPNKSFEKYYEPFLGSGIMFLRLLHKNSYLSDTNLRLIYTWEAIRDNVDQLIPLLNTHKARHCNHYFYEMRNEFNASQDKIRIASIFIYLMKVGFNGLYRENKKGEYNADIAYSVCPELYTEKNLRSISLNLQNVNISCHSAFVYSSISSDSFYYLDPPYRSIMHKFYEIRYQELLEYCNNLDKSGACFMLSNSNVEAIHRLFKHFRIETYPVRRIFSIKTSGRGIKEELCIRNY